MHNGNTVQTKMKHRMRMMNSRFEQMTNMFYTLSAIFTFLFAAVFGFPWWDHGTCSIFAAA